MIIKWKLTIHDKRIETKAFYNLFWREKVTNLDITSIEKETIIC